MNGGEMQSIKVDFQDGAGERTVYYKKRNLDQMDRVMKAAEDGRVEVLVVTVLTRCLTEHGSLMFSEADKKTVRRDFDPGEVLRVVEAIREFDAEVEKPGN
jgi:hypothetical protein